eukprot:UN00610
MVYFHGNGESASAHVNIRRIRSRFKGYKCNVLFAEYRGYSGGNGSPQLVT